MKLCLLQTYQDTCTAQNCYIVSNTINTKEIVKKREGIILLVTTKMLDLFSIMHVVQSVCMTIN